MAAKSNEGERFQYMRGARADVLTRLEGYQAAQFRGDERTAEDIVYGLANRCAQALIMLEREGIALPAEGDSCWLTWANEWRSASPKSGA